MSISSQNKVKNQSTLTGNIYHNTDNQIIILRIYSTQKLGPL